MFEKRGFTLIELVMVIVILGILAAIAIPRYYDLREQAEEAAMNGVVGGVRAGIATHMANNQVCPADLDLLVAPAGCDTGVGCFGEILSGAITDARWNKDAAAVYTYTGAVFTGDTFTYVSAWPVCSFNP